MLKSKVSKTYLYIFLPREFKVNIEHAEDFNSTWQLYRPQIQKFSPAVLTHVYTHTHKESVTMKWHQLQRQSGVNLVLKGFHGYWACSYATNQKFSPAVLIWHLHDFTWPRWQTRTDLSFRLILDKIHPFFQSGSNNWSPFSQWHVFQAVFLLYHKSGLSSTWTLIYINCPCDVICKSNYYWLDGSLIVKTTSSVDTVSL